MKSFNVIINLMFRLKCTLMIYVISSIPMRKVKLIKIGAMISTNVFQTTILIWAQSRVASQWIKSLIVEKNNC